ncbi:MAG: histidinol-phosphate transaminase [Elusimicrobia bacterium]|jgi:histidinol-phosphate aminotransferase|nr:histidinol-phosphate transaminase [Elusimicrobiota bacterium]
MEFINKRIKRLKAYKVPPVSEGEIKLDAQENPYPLPAKIQKKFSEILSRIELNRYHDPSYKLLKNLIGRYCGFSAENSAENILIGNGSDELILMLLIAAGGQGKTVCCPEPAFSMYRILSEITGTSYRAVKLDKDFKLPYSKILAVKPDIIFITYPNNPTGNCFSKEKIQKIITDSNALVIVDEAYYEFSGKTMMDWVKKYDNLVILRTFSKAFSLAGIRAGYIAGGAEIIKQLRKVQLPYNVSIVNQKLLEAVMEDSRELLKTVKKLNEARDRLFKNLQKIEGARPYPSSANYILIKLDDIESVTEYLKKNNIKVRQFKSPDLKNYLRVTIGTDKENKNFLDALKSAV